MTGQITSQVLLAGPDLAEPILPLGINGEVAGLAACLRHAGVETSFEELMGVTATAFRTHFFRPRDNPGMPIGPVADNPGALWSPRFAWSSLRHNNYGQAESAAFYYGGEVRPIDGLDALETWRLLRFELDAGRPIIAYGLGDPIAPDLIIGYRLEKGPLRQIIVVQARQGQVEFDLTGRKPADEGPYPRELLVVRPGAVVDYRGSDDARRVDALRWAANHTSTRRELVYESERFYATGPFAFEALCEFLRDLAPDELANPIEGDPGDIAATLTRFCAATLREWITARWAASAYLKGWSRALSRASRSPEGIAATPDGLDALADLYRASALALAVASLQAPVLDDSGAAMADADAREGLAKAVEAALIVERRALDLLCALI